ncbi:mitochondrial carrier protein [Trypanosoma rangeli]|uniref:Mitochondrial carrier protein n=1 Tax=Trypanosoma rangeli TaxID=5698 RepID=A0A422NVT9_TRYRA|nr:mitochondrial carrier protein [Trypanosoma rangeli]RNF09579.1 mitochondrial carrier protein [Trypanosoma rangeli]|eukprot:RNF09579.1 mitochondrial carrier protein [Trypanosoma rangeli]
MADKHDRKNEADSVHKVTVLQRFVGGTIGGMLQALTSHPFDTVKSRVQSGLFPGVLSCCRHTWANEGCHGFYRGLAPPLVMGGVYNSILFSLNQFMTNLVTPAGFDPKNRLPLWRTALAAWLTAPIYTLCITPMENVKVRLQLQNNSQATKKFTGATSCIRYIFVREGSLGFFAGYVPTMLSRLVGLPFYFSGYQLVKQQIDNSAFGATTGGRNFGVVISGCVAGVVFWLSNYPFDYMKTQLQSGGNTKRTFSEVFVTTYRTVGVRGFYRGLPACLVRAIPANASVWLGVEWVTRIMRKYEI